MKYKIKSINVVDRKKNEFTVDELIKNLQQDTIEEIVEKLLICKDMLNCVSTAYKQIEMIFLDKMNANQEKKYITDEYTINITPQYDYEYNVGVIDVIKKNVTRKLFNSIFTKTYKVNRNELKRIRMGGGELKELCSQMETRINRKPTVTIKQVE